MSMPLTYSPDSATNTISNSGILCGSHLLNGTNLPPPVPNYQAAMAAAAASSMLSNNSYSNGFSAA